MQYDGVKATLNKFIKHNFFRKLFYLVLDILILRQWYVKSEIRKAKVESRNAEVDCVLDAGAGFCQYSDHILSKYRDTKVVAVDLKTDFLEDYYKSLPERKKQRFAYKSADLQSECPVPSAQPQIPTMNYELLTMNYYDLVIAIDILEHIPDDIAVLNNFYKAMKPDSTLIISTPSDLDETAAFTEEHIRNGYSLSEITEKLRQTGFEVVTSKYTYGFWGKLYWKLIMKNTITMLNLSKLMYAIVPIYLLIVSLPALICMYIDFYKNNQSGNGLLVIAKKK